MSMKLHKVLTIGGVDMPLVNDDVRLDLKSPGRATFTMEFDHYAEAPANIAEAAMKKG